MLDALGIQESPALSQIRSWLQDFAARHDNVALTTPALDTVISLMSLLAGCHPSTAEVAGLRGPDVFARLQPLEKLFIDDAPWLKSRLDLSVSHIHDRLATFAVALHIVGLSAAVDEIVNPTASIVRNPAPPELARWEHVMTSAAFRRGILQLLSHEARLDHGGSKRPGPYLNDHPKKISRCYCCARLFTV